MSIDNCPLKKTILLVEDNPRVMDVNRQALRRAGYRIETAEDLAGARAGLARCVPDAIVLDILLPDGNGLDFIPELREVTTAPVLLLSALDERDDRLNGLRAGGDDYITKPYDIDELRERIAAFIRRGEMMEKRPPQKLVRGPLVLDTVASQALLSGVDLLLTPKEFSLLFLLMRSEGNPLSAEHLYKKVWNATPNDDVRTVKFHVSNLRKKLENSSYTIITMRGEGYRFEQA